MGLLFLLRNSVMMGIDRVGKMVVRRTVRLIMGGIVMLGLLVLPSARLFVGMEFIVDLEIVILGIMILVLQIRMIAATVAIDHLSPLLILYP
jgi:hypothetical protein